MAFPSLDDASKAAGNTVGGAVKYVAAPPFVPAPISSAPGGSGGVANSLVAGATRAGVSVVDGLVGGAENRTLIQQGAGTVVSSAKKLFTTGSVGDAAGGLVNGAVRAGTSVVDGLVGGSENRQLIQQAAGNVYDGAKDLITGKKSISDLFSGGGSGGVVAGPVNAYEDVSGMCMGPVGGDLFSGINASSLREGEGSDWGNLSRHLIARIYACDKDGVALPTEILGVSGPATDVNFEGTLNWQSPFESTGPEAKAPAIMAMLQSGAMIPVINAIQAVNPITNDKVNGFLDGAANKIKQIARDLEGRTGITKLNSRQVFTGMPPIKVTLTLHFRAISDAQTEVVEPYQRLLEFAMPQMLAQDGLVANAIEGSGNVEYDKFLKARTTLEGVRSAGDNFLKVMFPSSAPMMVGFIYGNNRYPAMVIESISNPLDGPMDSEGRPIQRAVQLTLATLTALDREDIKKLFV